MNDLPLALQPPDPAVRIRPVRLSDTSALYRRCWSDRSHAAVYQLVMHAQRIAAQGRGLGVVIMGDDDQSVVGYGQLTLWPRCGELSDLIVAEPYRGRGLGTTLIQYLARAAQDMHLKRLEIGAAVSNTGAIALYRRLGFQDSHTILFNMQNGREEVLYLQLELPDKSERA